MEGISPCLLILLANTVVILERIIRQSSKIDHSFDFLASLFLKSIWHCTQKVQHIYRYFEINVYIFFVIARFNDLDRLSRDDSLHETCFTIMSKFNYCFPLSSNNIRLFCFQLRRLLKSLHITLLLIM